MRSGEKPEKPG